MRSTVALGMLFVLTACASGGSGGRDAGMAYGVPADNPLTYERGDSLSATVEVPGMGTLDLSFDQSMTLGLSFAPSASGAEVTLEFQDYSARLSNPVVGTERGSLDNVTGNLVYTLDANGRANITESPTTRGAAAVLLRPGMIANAMLPRLPARPVSAGDAWTDTVSFSGQNPVGEYSFTWMGTYTVVGTVDDMGTSVTRVESEGVFTLSIAGDLQGMYVEQELSGPERGHFLWDGDRRVVVYYESVRELDGIVEADAAPGPMRMTGRNVVKTRLSN